MNGKFRISICQSFFCQTSNSYRSYSPKSFTTNVFYYTVVLPNLFCNVQRMLYGFQSWDNVVEACQQLLLQWKEKALHGKFLKKVSSIGELTYIHTIVYILCYNLHTIVSLTHCRISRNLMAALLGCFVSISCNKSSTVKPQP